jgi:hypothetical protein
MRFAMIITVFDPRPAARECARREADGDMACAIMIRPSVWPCDDDAS